MCILSVNEDGDGVRKGKKRQSVHKKTNMTNAVGDGERWRHTIREENAMKGGNIRESKRMWQGGK